MSIKQKQILVCDGCAATDEHVAIQTMANSDYGTLGHLCGACVEHARSLLGPHKEYERNIFQVLIDSELWSELFADAPATSKKKKA